MFIYSNVCNTFLNSLINKGNYYESTYLNRNFICLNLLVIKKEDMKKKYLSK